MSELQNNSGSGQDDRKGKVKLVDAKTSDAASVNERDTERMLEASEASESSYELHLDSQGEHPKHRKKGTENNADSSSGNSPNMPNADIPKATQDIEQSKEAGEELGGTTNLSLEQLKNEGDPAGEG